VIILTATMIGEDLPNANNQKLAEYNDFLRSLAAERKLPLVDLNADEQKALVVLRAQPGMADHNPLITVDGVHMNPTGDQMMATGILTEAFGFTPAQMDQARLAWLDLFHPVSAYVWKGLTERDYQRILELAKSQNRTPDDVLNEAFQKSVDSLVSTLPPAKPQP
jgi:hypothetical protein